MVVIDGEVIETTAEHPFYTDDERWVQAAYLDVGEQVLALNGDYGTVEDVQAVDAPQPMYNLTVDEAHTFFVGDGQWLVHNTCAANTYSRARQTAGIPEDAQPVTTVEFFFNPAINAKVRQISTRESLPYSDVMQRFINSTQEIPREYISFYEGTSLSRVGIGDPGAVGRLQLFDTPQGPRGIAYHTAEYNGIYNPHLHAIVPNRPYLNIWEWASALLSQEPYRALPGPDTDIHFFDN